ncbi:MAG: hypothetical protein LBV08_08455 [Clostridiales bacterium]|jgi:hypothetical protein|nr:hypothetical protein [Clostridiales bacterium]
MKQKKIFKSLKTLKKTCRKAQDCNTCPLGGQTLECLLGQTNPNKWDISEIKNSPYLTEK